jgi:hypothetical protein
MVSMCGSRDHETTMSLESVALASFRILVLTGAAGGITVHPGIALADSAVAAASAQCQFLRSGDRWTGSCGAVFDEMPVFSLAPAKSIATGIWREDFRPKSVWAGVIKSEGDRDSAVEIEVYAKGTGVLRSEYGWFNVSGLSFGNSAVKFHLDTSREIAPGPLDLKILKRADAILSAASIWNRADDRKCPSTATSWSIYCAAQRATIEITGGFHHRRPALELVRQIVDERTKGRNYDHRLMDYNNDPSTTLAEVHSLFAEAMRRIRE